MNNKNIISLDIARGIAALLVCVSHIRAYLFEDFSQLKNESKGIVTKIFYFITGLGHESVMIFFVLSGFLVAGSVHKSFEQGKFSWKIYLVNRLSRLYIVFIPALILTLFWDKLGIFLTHSIYYNGAYANILPVGPNEPVHHSVDVFLQCLLYLQTITSPVFGTNGVIWSLANEFWYYLIFPICMTVVYGIKEKNILSTFLSIVLLVCFFVFFPRGITLNFGIWLLGFVAFLFTRNEKIMQSFNKATPRILCLTLFIIEISIFSFKKIHGDFADYITGIIYMLVLLSFLKSQFNNNIGKKIFQFFSNISYTLYLSHVPVVAFFFCYYLHNNRMQFSGGGILIFAILLSLILLYAFLLYNIFEKRTPEFRKLILKKIIK